MDSKTAIEIQNYIKELYRTGSVYVPISSFSEVTTELSQIGTAYNFNIDTNSGMAKILVREWIC